MNDHGKKKTFLDDYQKTFGATGQCCLKLKISACTVTQWVKNDPEFKADLETLDRSFIDIIEKRVLQKIQDGDDKWMWRWLVCRAPERWRDGNTMSLTAIAQGNNIVATRYEIVDNIVDKQSMAENKPFIEVSSDKK